MDSGEHNDKNLREHCFAEILYNQWSKKDIPTNEYD